MKHSKSDCEEVNFTVTSPIGEIAIISCMKGLHSVKQCEADDSTFSPNERCCVKLKHSSSNALDCPPAQECITWLEEYFTKHMAHIQIPPLCSSIRKDGSFSGRAWQLLPAAAPQGTTITYKDLAVLCGNEKACRAAGHAMSSNPISYLVPCHRVVTTGNGIGNYSQGRKNKIKQWLLDFEKTSGGA